MTEEQFLRKSVDLERSLAEGKYVDFCGEKVEECTDAMEKNMWNFLKVSHVIVTCHCMDVFGMDTLYWTTLT